MPKSRVPMYAGIAIVAMVLGAWSAQFIRSAPPQLSLSSGTLLQPTRPITDFQLINSQNQPFSRTQLLGHWSVLFFGYTNCPDICPTTLSTLAQVKKSLVNLPATKQPQFVFVSVDPARDNASQLNNYVSFFDTHFIGLTGEQAQLDQLTKSLGVPVIIQKNNDLNYTVDHAANLFLLNPAAELTAVFSPPHTTQTLADDLRKVIERNTP